MIHMYHVTSSEAHTGQSGKLFLVGCCPDLSWRTIMANYLRHRTRSTKAVLRYKPAGLPKSKPTSQRGHPLFDLREEQQLQ